MPDVVALTPAFVGEAIVGFFRVGVYTDKWEQLINTYGCRAMTHRVASFPTPDSTTGIRTPVFTNETVYGIPVPAGGAMPPFAAAFGIRMMGALTFIGYPLYQGFRIGSRLYDPMSRIEYQIENVQTIMDPATYYDGSGAEVKGLAFYVVNCKLVEETSQIGGV